MSHSPSDWITTEIEVKRDHILEYAAEHGALNVRLFGPIGRDEPPADRHMFLVRMGPGRLQHDIKALTLDLRRLLNRPVGVVCEAQLPQWVLPDIRRRAVPLT